MEPFSSGNRHPWNPSCGKKSARISQAEIPCTGTVVPGAHRRRGSHCGSGSAPGRRSPQRQATCNAPPNTQTHSHSHTPRQATCPSAPLDHPRIFDSGSESLLLHVRNDSFSSLNCLISSLALFHVLGSRVWGLGLRLTNWMLRV